MRILIVSILIFLMTGLWIGYLIQLDAGYVRISWYVFLLETNVWIGLFLLLAIYAALYLLFKTLGTTIALKTGLSHWQQRAQNSRAQRRTTKGFLELAEGNWRRAKRNLLSSAAQSQAPVVNYLAAAQAANAMGDTEESYKLLQKAGATAPGHDLAIGLTQVQMRMSQGETDTALSTLKELRKKNPHHPLVLKLLQQTYFQNRDWTHLIDLFPELHKHAGLDAEYLARLEKETWSNALVAAGDQAVAADKGEVYTEPVNVIWDRMPGNLRKSAELMHTYAGQLVRLNAQGHALALLKKFLQFNWDSSLVQQYGEIVGPDPEEQLEVAENWNKTKPDDAVLLLTLGRLARRTKEWTKARDYLEASLKLKKSREVYAELGRLMVMLEPPSQASKLLLQALAEPTES